MKAGFLIRAAIIGVLCGALKKLMAAQGVVQEQPAPASAPPPAPEPEPAPMPQVKLSVGETYNRQQDAFAAACFALMHDKNWPAMECETQITNLETGRDYIVMVTVEPVPNAKVIDLADRRHRRR